MKRTHLLTALTAAAGGWFAAVSFQPARFATEADAMENPGGTQVANLRVPAEERRAGSTPTLRSSNARQCPMHPWVKSDKPARCTICGMNLTPARDAMTAGAGHGIVVALRAESISALDVRTEEARRRPLARTLRVAGMIGENESRHGVICAPVEGRIDALGMSCEGEKLTRHQPMLTLFSRTLLAAAGDYRAALAQGGDAIDQAADRLTKCGLVREQIISIPQRRTDDIHFGILAPLGGTITKSYVAEGQHVREGERLFEVADFATMWFNFVAYEADLPFLEKGQVVQVATPSLPGQITRARIAFINPILDEATRSTRVRVELHNPDGRFKINTFARGLVELNAPEVLTVPRTAVLRPDDSARVFVEIEPGHFQPRAVTLGRIGDALCEILVGLREGERVVTSGNLLIDAQAQLDRDAATEPPRSDTAQR